MVRAGVLDSAGIQAGTIHGITVGTEVGTIHGIAPGTVVTIRDGVIHTGTTRTGAAEVITPTDPTGLIGQVSGLDSEAE